MSMKAFQKFRVSGRRQVSAAVTIVCILLVSVSLSLHSQDRFSEQLRNRLISIDNDNDGITDIVERQLGTSPDSAEDKPLRRLTLWKFSGPNLDSGKGVQPRRAAATRNRDGIDGEGLSLDSSSTGAAYNIGYQEKDGSIRIAPAGGTLFFCFRPDWNSGTGPGHIAPIISNGLWKTNADYGYWGLTVTPDGTSLFLGIQKNGTTHQFLRAPINWRAGEWHHIRLTFLPEYAALFIDGEQVATQGKAAVDLTPDAALLKSDGIDLLCDRYGLAHASGTIDELEIYNYAMGTNNEKARYNNLVTADASVDPPQIRLVFPGLPDRPVKLSRRTIASNSFDVLLDNYRGTSWTDSTVAAGEIYEYLIEPAFQHNHSSYWNRMVVASTGARTKDPDGILAVVVDETLRTRIQPALEASIRNWVEDGWRPVVIEAPRHDDDAPHTVNTPKVLALKQKLKDLNNRSGGKLQSIVLVGHVVIPYSGRVNPDGHFFRPWEVDFYYGDIVGDEKWTDREVDSEAVQGRRIAGDGIWDPFRFPTPLEVPVGRIDFANLPAFRESETELLEEYLRKSIEYRSGSMTFPLKTAGFSSFPHKSLTDTTYLSLTRNAGPIVGDSLDSIFEFNFFKKPEPYLFGVQLGAGNYDVISNGNPSHVIRSTDFARNRDLHRTAFMILDGSYFGNWNTRNNFLRSALCVENGGLASIWGRHLMVRMHWLGAGITIGEALMNNINSLDYTDGNAGFSANIYIQLMGDPTLHLFPDPPLDTLQISGSQGSRVLQWQPADKPVFLEYSTDGLDGQFKPLMDGPVATPPTQTSVSLPSGSFIRARKVILKDTGSGKWTFLSHGIIAQVP